MAMNMIKQAQQEGGSSVMQSLPVASPSHHTAEWVRNEAASLSACVSHTGVAVGHVLLCVRQRGAGTHVLYTHDTLLCLSVEGSDWGPPPHLWS